MPRAISSKASRQPEIEIQPDLQLPGPLAIKPLVCYSGVYIPFLILKLLNQVLADNL